MFSLIASAVIGVLGHTSTRKFVSQKLRFTKVVERPTVAVVAGLGTTVVVGAVLAIPLVPLGTAAAVMAGIGVGTGVAMGSKDAKKPPPLLED